MAKTYKGYADLWKEAFPDSKETCPGTTTVVNRWKDPGGLYYYNWDQGRQGKDFNEALHKAGKSGNCTHEMVECDIRGKVFDRSGYEEENLVQADHAYQAYLAWKDQTNLKVIKPELKLISKKYRFGGTIDAMLIQDKLCLGDWKTSGSIWPEMLIQVAGGYSLLWEENYPKEKLNGGMQIIRFSKPDHPDDPISFSHHFWGPEIFPIAQRQFILFREAFDLDKRLKKLV